MATFVIVHGGFGGGWEWTPVALALRVQGHIVFTPTLTGMGERGHLGPDVGLATHVKDVVAVLEFEDLDEVILCGASYGGMAVTGAADRVADRIRLIAYVDALVPADGQSALDLLPEWFGDMVRAAADDLGHGWVSIPPALLPPEGLIAEKDRGATLPGCGTSRWRHSLTRFHSPGPSTASLVPSCAAQPATSTSAAIPLKRWLSGPEQKAGSTAS